MNLGKRLDWADMVMFHLKTPSAAGDKNFEPERLHDELGWLLEYQEELKQWHLCPAIVSTVLQFTNRQGVFPTLFHKTTPKMVKKRLANVSTDKYKQWIKNANLNNSTQARKTNAYKDSNMNRQKYCLT